MKTSALAAGVRHLRGVMALQGRHDDSDEQLLHAFTTERDDSAFAVLVRRYGPLVLGVCRRVLHHVQDAEDAFQATFLLLARNAAALRNKTALASWLHGSAYRLALTAKRSAARRRKHEGQTLSRPSADPAEELSWREVRTLLDEEIVRLPEMYRSVFVLCCLENVSREEASRRLELKEGTVSSRLTAARKRLAQRLARRGVELTAVLAASTLATAPVSALPFALVTKTMKTVTVGEGVSVPVTELIHSASAVATLSKSKMAAALFLMASLLAGAGWWRTAGVSRLVQSPPTDSRPPSAAPQTPREDKSKEVTVSGRVVDPDGKPVRGAKLLFLYHSVRNIPKRVWATSADEGTFAFTVPVKEVENSGYDPEKPREDAYVLAAAEGYGLAVTRLGKPATTDLTLRLVKDDVPIQGHIRDLQGKPVVGARVRIYGSMYAPEDGNLTTWFTAIKDEKRNPTLVWYAPLMDVSSPALDALIPPVTTGPDGRFCVKGIGRERIAYLRIEGPEIATQAILAMTRPSESTRLLSVKIPSRQTQIRYFGAAFDLVAAPTRPIVGVVRDKDTGKPLPGITIGSEWFGHRFEVGFVQTTTDQDGRYRLVGVPKNDGNKIAATTNELPYLAGVKKVANPLGLEPVTVDFALKRGLWVKGRVTEKAAGKPVSARVQYYCFRENPDVKEVAPLLYYSERYTEEDGSYRLAVLPGTGLIAVRARQDDYVLGVGAEEIKHTRMQGSPDFFDTEPHLCAPTSHHTLVEILPGSGEESIIGNVTLVRGQTVKGTVLDPDGKPLPGARVSGLWGSNSGFWLNAGAEFTVKGLQPSKPRLLQFVHDGRRLSGFVTLRGDEKEPPSVRLQSWGTLTGRLLTSQGDPLVGARVGCGALSTQTGKDGRFRIEGLAPGLKYNLFVGQLAGREPKNFTIKSGETKDLGDLRIKPVE